MPAAGEIGSGAETTTVQFPGGLFVVGLSHLRFPNGSGWSFFVCPCGRRGRTLRFYNSAVACKHCFEARGLRYRGEDLSRSERAAHVAARLAGRLMSDAPARFHPRSGRRLDRRGGPSIWRCCI
jgi:hypothetical protein